MKSLLRTRQNIQSCFACSSRARGIFSNLDRSHLMELDQMCQKSIYPAGTVLFTESDQPRGIYCICFGRVKLWSRSYNGQAVIIKIATAGDVIGVKALLSGETHNLRAKTLEPTQLCFIKKDDFLGFLSRNGEVSLRLTQKMSSELYEAYQEVLDIKLKRPYERLVELLLRLCQSHGEQTRDGIRLTINLSQEELSDMIGVSRRTLTRALTKLKSLGIIRCKNRVIIIHNRVALENSLSSEKFFDQFQSPNSH